MRRFLLPGSMITAVLLAGLCFLCGCKKKEISGQRPKLASDEIETQEPVLPEEPDAAEEKAAAEDAVTAAQEDVTAVAEKEGEEEKIPEGSEVIVLKAKKPQMPGVKFAHLKHYEEKKVQCRECHHEEGAMRACSECHKKNKGPEGEPSMKKAMHKGCHPCHKEKGGPTVCQKCHTK